MVEDFPRAHMTSSGSDRAVEYVLAHTLEHFHAIVQSSDDAIISKTLDGLVTSWNVGAESIFGYTEDEMVGKPILAIFPPDRLNEESYILQQILLGIKVDHFQTERVHKTGKRIVVSVTISPIRDRNGAIIGASKIARDITAQKATEAHLRLTASVFMATGEGILILDQRGLIADVNPAFTQITGYSRNESLGMDPQRLRSGRQGPSYFKRIRRTVLRSGEWRGELWSRRKDGTAYAVLMRLSKIFDERGVVCNYVALFSDVTVFKLQQERLDYVAHFDALTHLPNRLLLSDRLQQAMANCKRHQQMIAVLYMDIDGFKVVNDNFGHAIGDQLLITLSRQMRTALREGDTVARMGGDEFVVVLTDLKSAEDGIELVHRLLKACSQPLDAGGHVLNVSASIGVTLFPGDLVDAEQLIRHADHAMYEAKRTGKGTYHLFDAAQDAEVKHQSVQQSRIALALERNEFVLHYQPKVNMRTKQVVGLEALVRWQDPQRGLVYPGAFLPVIEKHPLNELLGAWVIDTALQQANIWHTRGLALPVSINVSARQFKDKGFSAHLAAALLRCPAVPPAHVELEILETSAFDDVASVQHIMHECQNLGVEFSLDDFGTGYSSLTYLKRFPVSTLKIDQSFIRDMLVDPDNLSIVKGIIGLAKAFNRRVIAEGVETDSLGQELLVLGCELAQGYAIAKPMPAENVAAWVEGWRAPSAWIST